jgi:hypothetical protein
MEYDEHTDIVRLSHQTVRDFVELDHNARDLLSSVDLAKDCLTYLAQDVFNDGRDDDIEYIKKQAQIYKFSRYAAQYWGLHTRGEAERSPHIRHVVLSLLASEKKRRSVLQMMAYARTDGLDLDESDMFYGQGQTLLHLISRQGLITICRLVLHGRIDNSDGYVLAISH